MILLTSHISFIKQWCIKQYHHVSRPHAIARNSNIRRIIANAQCTELLYTHLSGVSGDVQVYCHYYWYIMIACDTPPQLPRYDTTIRVILLISFYYVADTYNVEAGQFSIGDNVED